ncbi:PAS domain-containing protein [Mucilaginibacter sp. ZT4R22]|uniref:histidine kinase n=1 Tax=Mucilaginibacter pankratovii TaxID=2772110 RepID=A0ABR7WL53_9SPHI|nr:PAS domain-containing protein [Mucilaginibacter pankratovii]MBD1363059.1 PAS domain-containing protein [Mucilaginibacter pankratovii]
MNNISSLKSRPDATDNPGDLKMGHVENLIATKNSISESEEQILLFSNLFNLAPFPYFLLDRDGIIDQVNIKGAGLFGVSSESIIGKKFSAFITSEYIRDFDGFLDRLSQNQVANNCELKFVLPDKKVLHACTEGASLKQNGRITYYLVLKNLTDTLTGAYNVDRSKEQLELSLEASHAGTWELEIYTMRFYLVLFNRLMCPIPDVDFDGRYRTFIDYIHPEDRPMVESSFRKSIDFGVPTDVVCRFPTQNGEICYCRTKGQVITDNNSIKRLAGIMINVTDQVLAEKHDRELKASQQKQISLAIIEAEESERRRISNALHDSVNQLLYGVKMKLDILKPKTTETPAVLEIEHLVEQAISDVRNISFELAPSILVEFGLQATLTELADRLSSNRLEIRTTFLKNKFRPPLNLELNIFRIIQELINNSIKHSGASLIDIKIRITKRIEIELKDNGKGFNYPEQLVSPSGTGLSSIKNRLALYNCDLKIESAIGKGTVVFISFNP